MKPSTGFPWIALLALLGLACGAVTRLTPQAQAGLTPEAQAGSGGLTAQATSPGTVELRWPAVPGASGYRIEARVNDSETFPLAELPPPATEYLDFVLPGAGELTYRVIAVMGTEDSRVGETTISMSGLSPNPLVVEPHLFEPVFAIPTIDPANPMALFPPGFDPENPESFDLSAFLQDVTVKAEVGPAGGQVSATDPNGVTYTLHVPAGAIDEPLLITLTPIEQIDGFPLSGGLVGAIRIQPEGFPFDIPARLTIQPADASTDPSAPLTMGFAVSPFLQEFYLVPLAISPGASLGPSGGGHAARPAVVPVAADVGSELPVYRGGTYGTGTGSTQDVRSQAGRVPTDPEAQAAQAFAAEQTSAAAASAWGFRQAGESLLAMSANSDSAESIAAVADNLEQYWENGGSGFNPELNARLLDVFVRILSKLFNRAKGDCLTKYDLVASDLAGKLKAGRTGFWQQVAEAYRTSLGRSAETQIDELIEGRKACTFSLEFVSQAKLEDSDGWDLVEVHTPAPIQLRPEVIDGQLILVGFRGQVQYDKQESQSKRCPVVKITHYPQVNFDMVTIFPLWDISRDDARPNDYWLRYFSLGSNFEPTVSVSATEDQNCTRSVSAMGGGDTWGGFFLTLHFPAGIREWDDPESSGYPLVYTKEFRPLTVTVAGTDGTITENATYTLTIRRGAE